MSCNECDKKNKEITDLKGQLNFHTYESFRWRALFNQQRGGEIFNDLQSRYADLTVENIRMRNEMKRMKK